MAGISLWGQKEAEGDSKDPPPTSAPLAAPPPRRAMGTRGQWGQGQGATYLGAGFPCGAGQPPLPRETLRAGGKEVRGGHWETGN